MKPLLLVPSSVCGSQPDGWRDYVDRTMAQNEPLGLRFRKNHKTKTVRPLLAIEFATRGPQRSNAKGRPRKVSVANCGFEWRGPAFSIVRWCFPFNRLVEINGEHHRAELETQVSDQEEQGNTDGPPLGGLFVDVNISDGEIGARLVGRPSEHARDHHALDGPRTTPDRARDVDRRTREVARESVLDEEDSANVLGSHVEVLSQRTVSDKASSILCADDVPPGVRVACQRVRIRFPRWATIPREVLELVSRAPVWAGRTSGRGLEIGGANDTETREPAHSRCEVRNERGAPA